MSEQNKPMTAEEFWKGSHEYDYLNRDYGVAESALTDIPFVMEQYAAQETAALREELEETKRQRDDYEESWAKNDTRLYSRIQDLERELEAVKKERVEAIECMNYFENSDKEGRRAMVRFAGQRDKASAIIRRYVDIQGRSDQHRESDLYHHTFNEVIPFLESLSSEETKPVREKERNECEQERDRAIWLLSRYLEYAESGCIQGMEDDELSEETRNFLNGNALPVSPWISVDERLPNEGDTVAFVVRSSGDSRNNGRVLGGRYQGFRYGYHEFTTPGMGWTGSHWIPLPDPPQTIHFSPEN